MKKLTEMALILALTGFVFSACEKENTEGDDPSFTSYFTIDDGKRMELNFYAYTGAGVNYERTHRRVLTQYSHSFDDLEKTIEINLYSSDTSSYNKGIYVFASDSVPSDSLLGVNYFSATYQENDAGNVVGPINAVSGSVTVTDIVIENLGGEEFLTVQMEFNLDMSDSSVIAGVYED